jgi:hypothetical protein
MTEFPTHPGLVNQFPRKFSGFKEFDSGAREVAPELDRPKIECC